MIYVNHVYHGCDNRCGCPATQGRPNGAVIPARSAYKSCSRQNKSREELSPRGFVISGPTSDSIPRSQVELGNENHVTRDMSLRHFPYGAMRSASVSVCQEQWSRSEAQPPVFLA